MLGTPFSDPLRSDWGERFGPCCHVGLTVMEGDSLKQ